MNDKDFCYKPRFDWNSIEKEQRQLAERRGVFWMSIAVIVFVGTVFGVTVVMWWLVSNFPLGSLAGLLP